MNPWECIKLAIGALIANKMRAFLTMLGIIIGVSSVIVMISIVQGARQNVVDQFQGDGSNIVFAFYAPKRDREKRGTFDGLKMSDVKIIEQRVGSVSDLSPTLEQNGSKAVRDGKNLNIALQGCLPGYLKIETIQMAEGRFITEEDYNTWSKACVIGDKVRKDLFGEANPIGQELTVVASGQKVPLLVVGYLEYKGKNGFGQTSADEKVFVALSTVQKRFVGSDKIGGVSARANPGVNPETAADEIFAVLRQQHGDSAMQDIIVDTQEGVLKRLDTILIIFQLILGGVAGLSLLVGGIGIMNIMLVSVTERTREIGIRKAVGAKRGDILLQFVVESMTVSGVGGMIGVGLGYLVAAVVGNIPNFKTYIPPWAVFLGVGFAVTIGMFFGIYPALRASRLDPIVALRYE